MKKNQNQTVATSAPAPVFVQYGEYRGHPMITLGSTPNDRFPFSFGKKKAQLLCAALARPGFAAELAAFASQTAPAPVAAPVAPATDAPAQ